MPFHRSDTICACEIHPSGRGVVRCLYHEDVIREHQRMYEALKCLREGSIDTDPGEYAEAALLEVKWRD